MSAAPARRRPGAADAVAAEWIKLLTVRSTWWFAAGLLAGLLVVALLDEGAGEPGRSRALAVGLAGVSYCGQYVVAAFGLLVVTNELSTRSITVTFTATPVRGRVVVAKAVVAGAAAAVGGAVAAAIGVTAAAARHGELPGVLGAAAAQAAATGTYLGLLAVVALGVGAVVRRSAGALACMVVLLLVVPELLSLAAERWGAPVLEALAERTPGPAGWRLMTGNWPDALVLAGWAVAAVAAGCWALRRRDA